MVSPKSSFILYDLEYYRQDGQELSAYGGCLNIFSGTLSNNYDEEKEIIKQ